MTFPQTGGTIDLNLAGEYTAPAGGSVDFALVYSPYRGDAIKLALAGAYTAPVGSAVDFNLGIVSNLTPDGIISLSTDDATPSFAGEFIYTNVGIISAQTDSAAGTINGLYVTDTVINAVTEDAAGTFLTDHAVRITISVTTDNAVGLAADADIGFSSTVTSIAADAVSSFLVNHGVAAQVAVSTDDAVPSFAGLVIRYVVAGTVKDVDGFSPLSLTVRAHRLSDGALINETVSDPSTGAFSMVVGFSEEEFYIVAVETDSLGTDFMPPIASHVLSVLESG